MTKKARTAGLSLLLSVALLLLSFRGIDWGAFWNALGSCNWPLLVLSAVTGALMPACRSLRWRRTLLPFTPEVKRLDAIRANYVGYLANMAIPYTHEATRCIIMHRRMRGAVGYDKFAGLAVVERSCDALCILLLFLATAVLSRERYLPFLFSRLAGNDNGSSLLKSTLMIAGVIVAVLAAVLVIRKFAGGNRVCTRIYAFFQGIGEGVKSILNMERPYIYILETLLLWFIYWLQLYLGTRAIPSMANVSPADCLLLTVATAISSIVPVPGGFGAYHFMIASALSTLCQIPWVDGMAFATLVHESQTILLVLLGVVLFFTNNSGQGDVPRVDRDGVEEPVGVADADGGAGELREETVVEAAAAPEAKNT